MTTIHPTGLAALVANHKPFELIDVRPGQGIQERTHSGRALDPAEETAARESGARPQARA